MPVVLRPEDWARWLEPVPREPSELLALLEPRTDLALAAHAVPASGQQRAQPGSGRDRAGRVPERVRSALVHRTGEVVEPRRRPTSQVSRARSPRRRSRTSHAGPAVPAVAQDDVAQLPVGHIGLELLDGQRRQVAHQELPVDTWPRPLDRPGAVGTWSFEPSGSAEAVDAGLACRDLRERLGSGRPRPTCPW